LALVALPGSGGLFGATGYSALQQPVNARAVAMNGAYIADDGGTSLFWNPAGLSQLTQTVGDVSYEKHLLDVDGAELEISMPLWNGGFGFGLDLWTYGAFDQRDNQGNVLGSGTSAVEFWLTAGYGRELGNNNSLGVNTQLFVRNFDSKKSSVLFWTIGWQRLFPDQRLRVGIVASHWGTTLSSWQETPEKLPRQLSAGVSKRLMYLPLELHLDVRYSLLDNGVRGMLGGEFSITENRNLFLRLGLSTDRLDQITHVVGADFLAGGSFGFGFRNDLISIDYGAQTFGGAGMIHAFTLSSVFSMEKF